MVLKLSESKLLQYLYIEGASHSILPVDLEEFSQRSELKSGKVARTVAAQLPVVSQRQIDFGIVCHFA